METKVYKPKIVVSKSGKVYEYDYNRYKDHAQAHMRDTYVENIDSRKADVIRFKEKTRTCTVCNKTMNYYSLCNHVKSKQHLAQVEKIRAVDQFLNSDQFIDIDSDSDE